MFDNLYMVVGWLRNSLIIKDMIIRCLFQKKKKKIIRCNPIALSCCLIYTF